MSKTDDKRWAILPPPSVTSAAVSGQFAVGLEYSRHRPAHRASVPGGSEFVSHEDERVPIASGVSELEPADSDRVTEVPPESRHRFADANLETIPAPAFPEEE